MESFVKWLNLSLPFSWRNHFLCFLHYFIENAFLRIEGRSKYTAKTFRKKLPRKGNAEQKCPHIYFLDVCVIWITILWAVTPFYTIEWMRNEYFTPFNIVWKFYHAMNCINGEAQAQAHSHTSASLIGFSIREA